jgi:hypothetical protein
VKPGELAHLAAIAPDDLDDVPADWLPTEPASSNGAHPEQPTPARVLHAVPFDEFVSTEEAAAEPLLGDDDKKLLPAGSSLVYYGEGGSGKTTLAIDMAAHLAAGHEWLAFPIRQPTTVLLLENEGPRAEFRLKLARKRDTWPHNPFGSRVVVADEPWGRVDLRLTDHTAQLAGLIQEHNVDVLIAGPIRRLGLEGGGTPAETVAFMQLLDNVRAQCGRALAIVLVHHENKSGDISGAFEAEFDTVCHVKADGRDRTQLVFRKSRWSSRIHRSRFTLAWRPDTEGFTILETDIDDTRGAGERDQASIDALEWLTQRVADLYHQTGTGIPRRQLEDEYTAHHDGRGRNLARRIITRQITAYKEYNLRASQPGYDPAADTHRREEIHLATTTGAKTHGIYLIPFTHAIAPLAAPPNGATGANPNPPTGETPSRHSPPPIEKAATWRDDDEGPQGADDDIPF